MANMSYCRFENTSRDFADCVRAFRGIVENGEPITDGELRYAKQMRKMAEDFLDLWEQMEDDEIELNIETY